jgi:hypothetical protein
MLKAEDLAFVKALSLVKVSPALLKELRKAIAARRGRKSPTVPVGRRCPDGPVSSHLPLHDLAAKRKAIELTVSGGSPEPAARRPASDVDSPPSAGEQAASGGRNSSPPRVRRHMRL